VIVTTLDGLKDHCVPSAPAALLKAGVLALGLVALPPVKGALGGTPSSSFNGVIGIKKAFPTLAEQLRDTLGSGLRVCTWSTLPQGSGMGTSSILAGAMLFAMAQAIGKPYADDASLMHGVLVLEQLLTTGSCPSVLPHGLSPPLSRIAFFPARACRERFAFAFDFGRGAALLPRMISICGVRTLLCRARLIATLTRSVAIPAAARRAGEDRT
jgi:hypothetical protein